MHSGGKEVPKFLSRSVVKWKFPFTTHSTGKKEMTVTSAMTTPATDLAAVAKLTNKTNINTSRMIFSAPTKHK